MKLSVVSMCAVVLLTGCPKEPPVNSTAAPPGSAAMAPPGTAAPVPSSPKVTASAAPAASAPAAGPITWVGTYTSKESSLFVPDGGEWAGVKWRGDDAGVGIGDGTLTLTVDPRTGRAEGTGEGAIGPVVLTGMFDQGTLTFTIVRKDKADEGFTGSALAKTAGEKLEGSMKLSLASASVIRQATFSLARK